MAVDDSSDTQGLLMATPVYASKNLDVDDLEFDQECTYRKLPGDITKLNNFYVHGFHVVENCISVTVTDVISVNI